MKYILLVTGLILFISCNKYRDLKKNEVIGTRYITGKLFIADSITGIPGDRPLGKVTVKITTSESDESGYLFSTTTAEDGYFSISNLNDITYYLYAETKDTNGIVYTGKEPLSLTDSSISNFSMKLLPKNTQQNGIVYLVSIPGAGISANATVCMFSNWKNFDGTGCTNSDFTIKTNNYGKAFKTNVVSGKYIAWFEASYAGATYTLKDTVDISNTVVYKNVVLQPKETTQPNGISYFIKDDVGTPVKGCTVCLFSSYVLANDSCVGANYAFDSDEAGIAEKTNIVEGNYIAFMKIKSNSLTLKARDTIIVPSTGIKRDTATVK